MYSSFPQQASLDNYRLAHPEEFVSPLPTIRKVHAKAVAAEAVQVSIQRAQATSPRQANMKPVAHGKTVVYPPIPASKTEPKTSATNGVYDDTSSAYDDTSARDSTRESNVYSDLNYKLDGKRVTKSHSRLYKAKSPPAEPVYGSVIPKSSVKNVESKTKKNQPDIPPPRRLKRTPMEATNGKGKAPEAPANTNSKHPAPKPPSEPYPSAEHIYQDIPADKNKNKTAGLPNGTVPSGSVKRKAPPVPSSSSRGASKGLAQTKKEKSADQVSSALAQLDEVVNNPLWTAGTVLWSEFTFCTESRPTF